jgi:hypothetical protein
LKKTPTRLAEAVLAWRGAPSLVVGGFFLNKTPTRLAEAVLARRGAPSLVVRGLR